MKPTQPSLQQLTQAYMAPIDDAGLDVAANDAIGDVLPHEVTVGFRTDPRVAWAEAFSALKLAGLTVGTIKAPNEWASIVVRQGAIAAQPMAVGQYPQRVREVTDLFQAQSLRNLLKNTDEAVGAPSGLPKLMAQWQQSDNLAEGLLAVALARATGNAAQAESILNEVARKADAPWAPTIANERATTLWFNGEHEQALAAWAQLGDFLPGAFNRGMAALFLGQRDLARTCLSQVIERIPETSPWHHLASLYLTLCDMVS